ncbi:hypothetical protein D5086_018137 [Populus alba]|uniref:Uncharacterized protein n=1 Tax=Populus alba TaxID=43335 RepID=A0ACC4BNY1_POPAL
MALTPALVNDVIGIIVIIAFETFRQGQSSAISVLWFVISVIILVASGIVFTRRALIWIVENTPEEKPVNQSCSFHSVVRGRVLVLFGEEMGEKQDLQQHNQFFSGLVEE